MGIKIKSVVTFMFLGTLSLIYLNIVFKEKQQYNNTAQEFNDLANKTNIDILFFGNSHTTTSFNPLVINANSKTISFNLGSPLLKTSVSNLAFKEAIKKTKPKLVILEFSETSININKDTTSKSLKFQYRVFDNLPILSKNHFKLQKELYGFENITGFYSPVVRNHNDWYVQDYFSFKQTVAIDTVNFYNYKGYLGLKETIKDTSERRLYKEFLNKDRFYNKEIKVLTEDDKSILRDFVQMAKKNDIKVLLIATPELSAKYNIYNVFEELENFAVSLDIDFLNLNEHYSDMNLVMDDFFDTQHLNLEGSNKLNLFLSNYINQNYNLPDRSNSAFWKESASENEKFQQYISSRNSVVSLKMKDSKLLENLSIEGLEVKKISGALNLDIHLTNVDSKSLSLYKLAIHLFPKKSDVNHLSEYSKSENRDFEILDIPLFDNQLHYKTEFVSPINNIEKFHFFLYKKDGYDGVVGNEVWAGEEK